MAFFFELLIVLVGLSLTHGETGNTLTVEPKDPTLIYRNGALVTLICQAETTENSTSLEWKAPGVVYPEKTEKFDDLKYKYVLKMTLKIISFNSNHSGNYVCNHWSKDKTLLSSETRILMAVKEIKKDYQFMEGNETALLSCKIDLPNIKSVKWLLNSTYVSELKDKSKYVEQNETLNITKPERKQAGLYIARFTISKDNKDETHDCEVYFTASPLVEDFEKSKNLIQDDNMELQCKVLGFPYAVVTWLKDEVELNVTGQVGRVILTDLNGYKNARLQIKNVEFSDAGDYKCIAYSQYFNDTSFKTVTVRVKDKLAALWPFLGIVGEVVVLCTIIFIYEKRRNKQAEQEEINAQEADDAASDKKEGLRHRNTNSNNPTA